MLLSVPDTPPASGMALFHATLKSTPVDFRVDEILGFEPDESGEHLYLQLEKRDMNTNELAELLENTYSVSSRDVGYAGMKDRHAITCQWFSVTTPRDENVLYEALNTQCLTPARKASPDELNQCKEVRIRRAVRHSRKLRRGAHRANRFSITLRDVKWQAAIGKQDREQLLTSRIQLIKERGFPNYIGPQRFGHGGQNFRRAQQWFANSKKRTSRQQRSIWLSAARSALFNSVCAARVQHGSWHELLNGELEKAGLKQERRALRAQAKDLSYEWLDESTIKIDFLLSPGVFATTLLKELCLCHEPERG